VLTVFLPARAQANRRGRETHDPLEQLIEIVLAQVGDRVFVAREGAVDRLQSSSVSARSASGRNCFSSLRM
jgi:hypothetical protein